MQIKAEHEHVCDPTIPVCTCGYVWEYEKVGNDGSHRGYTCAEVAHKFHALYGLPSTFRFVPVARDDMRDVSRALGNHLSDAEAFDNAAAARTAKLIEVRRG